MFRGLLSSFCGQFFVLRAGCGVYIHSRDAEIAGVKKQRFATLTKDEYATLSTLLQERESNNTRRATDMAARTCIDSLSLLLRISLL